MAKRKKGKPGEPADEEALKGNIEGFRGGLPINLDRIMESGNTLRDELSGFLKQILTQELKNQERFINSIPELEKNYKMVRDEKTFPWPKAASTASPITRSNVDTIFVRIIDILFRQPKIILVKVIDEAFVEIGPQIEEAVNHYLRNVVDIREKLSPAIKQGVKIGTGLAKIVYESKKRTVVRYANEMDELDDSVTKYKLAGTKQKAVKEVVTEREGPNIYPIDRADWVISSDAVTPDEALMCGFKKPYRRKQAEAKGRQGLWDSEEIEKIVEYDLPEKVREQRAKDQSIDITQFVPMSKTFDIWELWVKYDVDEDGEEDDIVVTFHQKSGAILRAIYNPIFMQYRPFQKFTPMPSEYRFDGEGVCQILEKPQLEIDTLHNQRLDRLTQINCPPVFVRIGSQLENLEHVTPGRVYHVDGDPTQEIMEMKTPDVFPSTFAEENMLIAAADRAVGITPAVMGLPTADRPVFRESAQNLQESNKKFKDQIDTIREQVQEIIMKKIEMFAQYQPEYTYTTVEGEKITQKTVNFPIEYLRDGLKIEMYASSEVINQELRREMNMSLYMMMSDYYTKITPSIQMIINPMVPLEFKKYLLGVLQSGHEIVKDILRDLDKKNIETILIDVPKWVDLQAAFAQTLPPQAQLQQQMQGGQPQQQGQPQRPPQRPQGR